MRRYYGSDAGEGGSSRVGFEKGLKAVFIIKERRRGDPVDGGGMSFVESRIPICRKNHIAARPRLYS
jgi:hypothetical protein